MTFEKQGISPRALYIFCIACSICCSASYRRHEQKAMTAARSLQRSFYNSFLSLRRVAKVILRFFDAAIGLFFPYI